MVQVYGWKAGFPTKGIDAQDAGECLEGLRGEGGTLTAEIVLKGARRKDSPIHAIFEWDNKKASIKYRNLQAGDLIRSVTVVVDQGNEKVNARAFVNVQVRKDKSPSRSGYITIGEALSDEDYRLQILSRALGDLRAFQVKYKDLKELVASVAIIVDEHAA